MKSITLSRFCLTACLILLSSGMALCISQPVGNVTGVTPSKTNGVILTTSSRAKVLIEFFDQNVIRVRLAPNGQFERDFSYAIDYSHDRKTPAVKIAQTATQIVVTNFAGAKVVIRKAPFLVSVFDENGKAVI